jgi:hypothetical protein
MYLCYSMRLETEQDLQGGLTPEIVEVTSLKRWSDIPPLPLGPPINPSDNLQPSPFPFEPRLNDKIVLW